MEASKPANKIRHIGRYREAAPDVYYLEVGKGPSRANVFFVRSGPSWVLIDAANTGCGRLIRKNAELLFGAGTRPSSILLTHDHPDHAGSALELVRLWNCPLYIHPDEIPLANGGLSEFKQFASPLDRWIVLPLLRLMPRRRVESIISGSSLKGVVQSFDPEAGVPGLPDWECIHAPGHTPGQVAFFRRSDRVLITGDAIVTADLNSFAGILSWVLRLNRPEVSGPPRYSTWDWTAAQKSVAVLAKLEPGVIASGHGVPVSGVSVAPALQKLAGCYSGPAAR